jgi:quinol monooxygenase YgiN
MFLIGEMIISLTINIYYTGENGSARKFAEEMVSTGIVERVRGEKGNLKYEYFFSMDDEETVLLIDRWENQEALDMHHKSEMMKEIAALREKYHLHMKVEQFVERDS